jgi:hypothetical protein
MVANIGSAPSSIRHISIGYHCDLRLPNFRYIFKWFRYSIGWLWLRNQTVALNDFQAKIGGNIKIYPFLIQRNFMSPVEVSSYLDIGQSSSGVIYFEQQDSWGGFYPIVRSGCRLSPLG